MSMIVAIEPDRRRAAQLTGMARAHLHDELLVAATAAQAVDALNGRVPDVLLTAPLLPSQEESAIHEYLRQLGSAAAHVQTLTIPLLASTAGEHDRPVLSAFRRGRTPRVEAEGCDPAVFAEQITEYLREAHDRKAVPPVALPAPAAEPVSSAPEPARVELEIDVASFVVDDAPRALPGRRFKELLASFDVTEDDEPLVFAPTIEEPPGAVLALPAPSTISAFDSEPVGPTIDSAAPSTATIAIADPPMAATFSGAATVAQAHKSRSQDNWAFFDPSQCGFPALVAKLDEIASRDSDG